MNSNKINAINRLKRTMMTLDRGKVTFDSSVPVYDEIECKYCDIEKISYDGDNLTMLSYGKKVDIRNIVNKDINTLTFMIIQEKNK